MTPGYILRAVGSLNTTVSSELWRLTLSATGQVPAFVVTRAGFQLAPDALPMRGGAAKLLLERLAPPRRATKQVLMVAKRPVML